MDRFPIPVLPSDPSPAESGVVLYYYHCMPCHGDRGQGLTDEFRELWVDDHQNCWGRGCHAGRPGDEGFPLPRAIPAVIGGGQALAGFPNAPDLEVYLRMTHPPQRPGALSIDEYRDLTAFLWQANGRAPQLLGNSLAAAIAGSTLVLLAGSLLAAWAAARRTPQAPPSV
jgi:hypothetical protein